MTLSKNAGRARPGPGEAVSDAQEATEDLVSVIIPARNEERSIGATLDALRGQDYRNLQIIVADGGSTDGTVAVVQRHMAEDPRVELVHNPRQITPVALNVATAQARGPWLVRMDAHSMVDAGYVGGAVARLREGRWGGVGGRKDGGAATPPGRAIAAALGSRFGVGGSVYHHGIREQEVDHIPFGAYPTELVRRLGGWDERLMTNQDFEFDYRLRRSGARLLFDPRLRIAWQSKESVRDFYRQYRRYGRGKVDVALLHPRSLQPRHLGPPLLIAYLVASAAVGVRRPGRAAAMVAPYAVALTAASVTTARTLEDPRARPFVPAAFLAMHIGWGIGVWSRAVELLTRRTTR
ncbi:glycosyl transferase family 2 [Blastococcus colisei]|uniref:Glycosyl transferase family 2 n=1 Tax=Blastococcus colisei TaxID=1564162 RepID=A0A543P1J4_9ACTN|nr:glycosyltransferase family 2 protein [Blastococcus colisei]TQN37893.1 glycosyl transferase family 2 [Blastococcus colisei]